MTAKPTLGYASRTEAVRALQSAGLSPREIAGRIGISTATVAALRRRPPARAGDGPNRTRPIEFDACIGRLGLFEYDETWHSGALPERAARWMIAERVPAAIPAMVPTLFGVKP